MARRLLSVVLLIVASRAQLAAESPTREEVQQLLLMTRRCHFQNVACNGIWQLEPGSLEYRRLRLFAARSAWQPGAFDGGDGFLSAHGDVLTYRTWPSLLDFDAFSFQRPRRLTPCNGPTQTAT